MLSKTHRKIVVGAVALVLILSVAAVQSAPAARQAATMTVEQYELVELVFDADSTPENPFDTYLLRLEVTPPDGEPFTMDGFYDGDGQGGQTGTVWKARLAPDQVGTWTWQTVLGDSDEIDSGLAGFSGTIEVVEGENRGGVTADGRYFRYQNGEPVYLVGNFLDFATGLLSTHLYMSEMVDDAQREAIFTRQRDFHNVNKVNMYFANVGDYRAVAVTPWVGESTDSDRTQMDVARWTLYDQYIGQWNDAGVVAEMWFLADDSNFGDLTEEERERLIRYGMARTSAMNTMYVLSLEWQEGHTAEQVRAMGRFAQEHNPWDRLISVHSLSMREWAFPGESWADFIASQTFDDPPDEVNRYAREMGQIGIPHINEEFGHLDRDGDFEKRAAVWANFTGGAAGAGTGSDLRAFQRFLAQSEAPYWRMEPANELVEGGGENRFVLAESGRNYVVYSAEGAFDFEPAGSNLIAAWFNPRDPEATLGESFSVAAGRQRFTPPADSGQDWVLWVTSSGGPEARVLATPTAMPTMTPSFGQGLVAEYYNGVSFETLVATRIDPDVQFNWRGDPPADGVNADGFSARWTGTLVPGASDEYTITLLNDDGARLWLGDELVIDDWEDGPARSTDVTLMLEAGQRYPLRLEYYERGGLAQMQLLWARPGQSRRPIPTSALLPE